MKSAEDGAANPHKLRFAIFQDGSARISFMF